MGMFDTVKFSCPSCKQRNEYQTKSGPCELNNYSIDTAPLSVLACLNEAGKANSFKCDHCNEKLVLQIQFKAKLKVSNPDFDLEGDGTRIV